METLQQLDLTGMIEIVCGHPKEEVDHQYRTASWFPAERPIIELGNRAAQGTMCRLEELEIRGPSLLAR